MTDIHHPEGELNDLMKANALLHALISNREAEIEQLRADLRRRVERPMTPTEPRYNTNGTWNTAHDVPADWNGERADPDSLRAEIERLRADKDVIRSQERNAAYERDIAALEAEIERLGAALKDGWSTLAIFNVNNYHPALATLKAQLRAALEQKFREEK